MNQPYNPYGNLYGLYNNPYSSYQTQNNQNQMYMPQQQMVQPQMQIPTLNGEFVDGIDVVKAKNVDMSGNITIYPKSDLTEIYTKRLIADGTSQVLTYKLSKPEEVNNVEKIPTITPDSLNVMFEQLKTDIIGEIQQILNLQQKGGSQK